MLAGCASPPPATRGPAGIHDPLEAGNRQVHAFNKGLARAVLPEGEGSDSEVGRLLRTGANNFAGNLGGPSDVLNALLQGRVENAGHTAFRFAINSTVGVAGLFDPARSWGLEPRQTDFGETLHVWGVGEGPYLEMPFLGPSTLRDASGDIVDTLINPLRIGLDATGNRVITAANIAEEAADAAGASGLIGDILETSADSYAQLRLVYLQNRRFELARAAGDRPAPQGAALDDPYAAAGPSPNGPSPNGPSPDGLATDPGTADPLFTDPYAEAAAPAPAAPAPADPHATDPYEDPYAF
jgi:phospholipid-binding lipoprotein MlaA